LSFYKPPLPENYGKVDAQLFLSDLDHQPLIVAFGGSQGGNTWTEDYWAEMRNSFLQQGYAVLSIGYFNTADTPQTLDRISLNAIYDTIISASNHPKINQNKIALLGSSKGGELVLNLASRYEKIDAVVALVPSNVTFPSITITGNTSSWTYHDKELTTIETPLEAIWLLLQGDSQGGLKIILENEKYWKKAAIEAEKINGPILLLSAKNDDLWPSDYMSEKIVERLKEHQFKHYYQHISFEGKHHDTKKHFDVVFQFLNEHFKSN
jgi:dienelactone hydrolase